MTVSHHQGFTGARSSILATKILVIALILLSSYRASIEYIYQDHSLATEILHTNL
jgi:hypothetical protein